MNMREGRSEFLTEIAKRYDSRIMAVTFLSLRGVRGNVWKPKPPYNDGLIRIEINANSHVCEHQRLYTFFHEVGHVILGHCDPVPILKTPELETEATDWAFRQMGIIDHNGQVKQVNEVCYHCIDQQLKTCPKGFTRG